jgi:hypothetical protein
MVAFYIRNTSKVFNLLKVCRLIGCGSVLFFLNNYLFILITYYIIIILFKLSEDEKH